MHTQLEQLVKICERAEARAKRKLLAASEKERECKHDAALADACLQAMQLQLQKVNRQIVHSDGLDLQRFQSMHRFLDRIQENLDQLRGDVRRTHNALAIAEQHRSQCSARVLAASVKLENARFRELQWCCHRDAIKASQQEEYSIESWFLRQGQERPGDDSHR